MLDITRGVGYCKHRSRYHGKRLGHLFTAVCRITRVEGPSNLTGKHPSLEANSQPGVSVRCTWCWTRQT